MKKLFVLNICIVIFFFTSNCRGKNSSSNVPIIKIGAAIQKMQKIYLSQFTDNVCYVPLESNPENPISWTTQNLSAFSKEYILYSDGKICQLFNTTGRYLRNIGKQGRGPGEYIGIISIFLINEKIYIRDILTDDLIEYKLDGKLIQRHKSGFTANDKYRMEDGIMINDSMIFGNIENRTGHEENKALIIDKKGEVKCYYKNYLKFELASGIRSVKAPVRAIFNTLGMKFFFKECYNDTIFQLDDKFQLKPTYVFDLGKYKEPLAERGMRWDQKDLSSYINVYNVYQTKNIIIIDCGLNKYFPAKRFTPEIIKLPNFKDYIQWYNTTSVLIIYDKSTGNIIAVEPTNTDNHLFTSGLYNDFDAGPRFFPDKMVNDSTMVMKIRFDRLVAHIKSNDFRGNLPKCIERKKRLEMMVDSLKKADFDNPILMFVTFKKR